MLQTYPSSSIGPRFNNIDDIPDSDSESAIMEYEEEEDPEEAAESKLALTVISLLFGLVVILILVVSLYFVARDDIPQMQMPIEEIHCESKTLWA